MKHIVIVLMIALFGASSNAAEFIGEPCRAANVLASGLVRADGKEYFAMVNMNEISHAELILIDTTTGEGKSFKAPAGAGCWAMQQVDPNRVVLGTYYDGTFMVFDLKAMKFTKAIQFPGEQYLWEFAMGNDGRLYTGTYPGGKLGALDLQTYKVEDLGNPSKPNLYCREVSTLPDGRIYCRFEMTKETHLVFDPKTKQFSPAPKEMDKVPSGVVWNHYFIGREPYDGKSPIAFDQDLKPVEPLPFPQPTGKDQWSLNESLTTADDLYLTQGNSLYHFRAGQDHLDKEFDADLHGGHTTARASDGTFFGFRGQRYFTIKRGESEIHLHEFPVEISPRQILFLRVDPHGVIWGGPTFGLTLFSLDPSTKKFVNTDTVCNGGGEVYDVAFANDKVYAVSYSGGDITVYDPHQPWDQFHNKNPKTLVHLVDRGYMRPVAGVVLGDDHLLYSGWMAEYGKYGGAVAITDPNTEKTELIENPLGPQDIVGIAVDDHYIYLGTNPTANGLAPKPGAMSIFGAVNKSTHKPEYTHSFKANSVHSLARDRATGIVAFAADNDLYLFDPSKLANKQDPISTPPKLPHPGTVPSDASVGSLVAPGDGHLYFASGNTVYSLDLKTMNLSTVGTAPVDHIEQLAIGPNGAIYVSASTKIYRLN